MRVPHPRCLLLIGVVAQLLVLPAFQVFGWRIWARIYSICFVVGISTIYNEQVAPPNPMLTKCSDTPSSRCPPYCQCAAEPPTFGPPCAMRGHDIATSPAWPRPASFKDNQQNPKRVIEHNLKLAREEELYLAACQTRMCPMRQRDFLHSTQPLCLFIKGPATPKQKDARPHLYPARLQGTSHKLVISIECFRLPDDARESHLQDNRHDRQAPVHLLHIGGGQARLGVRCAQPSEQCFHDQLQRKRDRDKANDVPGPALAIPCKGWPGG